MNMKCHTCAAARTDQPNVICPSGYNVDALFNLEVECIYAKKDFPTLFGRSSQPNFYPAKAKVNLNVLTLLNAESAILL